MMLREPLSAELDGQILIDVVTEAHQLHVGGWANHLDRLIELDNAANEFVGRLAVVTALSQFQRNDFPSRGPISAYYDGHDWPRDWTWDVRIRMPREDEKLLLAHPPRATGIIEDLDLKSASLRLKPRYWSPYRRHKGSFEIALLGRSAQPQVEVKFVR